MARRTITVPPITRPTGAETTTATLTVWLVDADHRELVGWSDSQGIIGPHTITLCDEATTLDLTPQSEIAGASYWAVRVQDGAQSQTWYVQVPAGSAEITLPALIGGAAVEPGSIIAGLLLPDPTELDDGRLIAVSDGAWVDIAPPSDAGDMLAVVYDPGGVAGDAFDLETHTSGTAAAGQVPTADGSGGIAWADQSGSGSASVAWGEITGTISDQTDLTPAAIGAATAAHDHTGIYEPAGTAESAVSAHTSSVDHSPIATALQPGAIGVTVASQSDARFTDARTPTVHAASHGTGQADAIAPADIGAATASHDHSAYEPVRADPVYPDSVTVDAGTLIGGTASDLGSINETYVQVQEASGADPLTVRLTFTDVTEFNQLAIEGRYEGSAAHELAVEIYHVANELYALVGYVSDMDADAWMEFAVPHPADYIDGSGTVVVRLRHIQSGVTSHNLYLDYAALRDAASGGGVTSHPGLTGRSVADAHPISAITGLQTSLDNAIPKPSTGLTEQTTLADSDQFALQESGGTVKKTLWSTIKSAITALLGTAAFKNTGTSGNTVPLLNTANTWSGTQTISHNDNNLSLSASSGQLARIFYSADGGSSLWYLGARPGAAFSLAGFNGSAWNAAIGCLASGDVGIGTLTPAAKLDVNGYSKFGESAPNIKCKKIAGTTADTEGGTASETHGLTSTDIISLSVLVHDASGVGHGPGDTTAGYQFGYSYTSTAVVVSNHATNSENITSKPFTALIWYEE